MGSVAVFCECAKRLKLCHIVTHRARRFKPWNELRTNRGRIADSSLIPDAFTATSRFGTETWH